MIAANNNKGRAFDKLKLYQKSIESYVEAINLNPIDSIAYYNKGFALFNLEEYNGCN